MKTVTASPVEIAILRRSEKGESFSHIAEQSEIIEMLGEKYATPSQRVEKLKRMAERADWHRFQLRRKGLELPEALPRLTADAPQVQRVDKSPAVSTSEIAESAQPEEPPQTEFGKLAAELKRPIFHPQLEHARRVFQFPSGRVFESAHHPQRPGAPVTIRYEGGVVRRFVDTEGNPVVIVNVHRNGFRGETLDENTGEWRS